MERLTYKTNGKYLNTTAEQAPPYSIDCDIDTAITKLAEYEDLEEQGKLMKLFCVRGDTVWFIKSAFSFAAFPIEAKVVFVNGVDFDNDVIYSASVKDSGINRRFKNSDIGKTVFLTREEAEAALKELERGKGE
nr:hypothetical protein [uncultured Acetatifactor sp.]